MNIEERLERELASRAANVTAAGDLDEVRARAVRRARTQTGLRLGVVALLIAGAGAAGFGLGRGQTGDDVAADAVTSPVTDPPADTAAPPALDDGEPPEAPGATPSTMPPAPNDGDDWGESAGDAASRSAGMLHYGWGSYSAEPPLFLVERVTPSGATVRVSSYGYFGYEGEYAAVDPASSWAPAPWCFPSGELRVALSAAGVIDVGYASWFDEPYRGLAVYAFDLGRADGAPWQVLVVQPPAGANAVTATFPDGASDQAAVANGVAVLAVPGDRDPTTAVLDLAGVSDADAAQVGVSDLLGRVDDEYHTSCNPPPPPPPPLPPAGEQPADPAAAEAQLRDVLAALFNSEQDLEQRLAFVDDTTGLADAFEQVATGPFADVAGTAVHTVQELVFTSPTEAWFRYSIDTSITGFANRYGRAVLVDGQWKITRQTVCQDLALATATCTPDAGGTIYPPGSEHWYDQFYGDVLEDEID